MSYFKYILKGFKTNISRLLAIIAIITLGIGFLVGLSTSSTDIRTSVNAMYTESNVMDLNLKSTIGFSQETVDKLNNRSDMDAEGVFQLEPKESFLNTSKMKSRLISTDIKNSKINKLTLVDGRMPEAKSECVVLKDMEVYFEASIGDKIIIKDEKMDINETYTVVGIVSSPLYFAKDKEYNLTGTNRLDLLYFVDSTLNDFDLITDIYIRTTVKDDRFSTSYFDKVNEISNEIEAMEDEILNTRTSEIKADIKKEIIDTKLDEIKDIVNEEIKKEIRTEILKEENYQKLIVETNKAIRTEIRTEILKPENYETLKAETNKAIRTEITATILEEKNYQKLKEETNKAIKAEIKAEILRPENYGELKNEVNKTIKLEIKNNILLPENYETLKTETNKAIKEEIKNNVLLPENYETLKAETNKAIRSEIEKNILLPDNYKVLTDTVDNEIKKGIREEILKEPNYTELKKQADYKAVDQILKQQMVPEIKNQLNTDPAFAQFKAMAQNNANNALKEAVTRELKEANPDHVPTEEEIKAAMDAKPQEVKDAYLDLQLTIFSNLAYDLAVENPIMPQLQPLYEQKELARPKATEAYEASVTPEQREEIYAKALNRAVADQFSKLDQKVKDDAYKKAVDTAANDAFNNMSEADLNKAYDTAVTKAVDKAYGEMSEAQFNEAYDKALDEAINKAFNEMSEADLNKAYDTAVTKAVDKAYGEMSEAQFKEAYDTAVLEATNTAYNDLNEAQFNKAYDTALNEAVDKAYGEMSEAQFQEAYATALDEAIIKGFDEMKPEDKEDAYNTAIDEAVDKAYDEFIKNGDNEEESKLNSYTDLNSSTEDKKYEELFILNLKANQSYVSVKENSNKIDKIAVIFPVFFYFIAALVALTTITRLVDEERGIIGLFKSLGFSKFKILSKYLLFALVCSVVGSALGNLAGVYALPYVVYGAYKTILDLPPMVYTVEAMINGISVAMMILTIMGVATYVTLSSLKERPAQLLQPKAPRPGKRLLLERWKGLWKRIKFKYKNTIRNIFRYKKNLIMMMVGVGGCVALLLTAFGIRDAFDTLASVQYDKIITYDLRVNVDNGSSLPDDILNKTVSYDYVNNKLVYLNDDDDYQISRIITNASMEKYFTFKHDGKPIEFNNGDVVLDAQVAKKFGLRVGSTFKFDDSDKEYTLTGIFDNHIDNYAFIYDEDLKSDDCNTYFMNLADGVNEDELLEDLELTNVLGVESISQRKRSFDTMLSSVVLILVVVIICSGALAIIVIYNLTNININERLKEIATLKVLGYQNREVYGYIYREIFVLTIFGILLGFLVGPFLYKFVMLNLNEPGLCFPTSVHPLNYLYSFLFTLLFAFIVDLILVRKIKNIKMVESLKCVD